MVPLHLASFNLLGQAPQAVQEARPVIFEQWPVNLFEAFLRAGVHADIQLSDRDQISTEKANAAQIQLSFHAQYFRAERPGYSCTEV